MSARRSQRGRVRRYPAEATQAQATPAMALPMIAESIGKHSLTIFFVLVAVASLRIVSTYSVFSHTFDEPAHIACGMEWLVEGTYGFEPQHPPLARVAVALGPYLANRPRHVPTMAELGLAHQDLKKIWDSGLAILYRGGLYERTLAFARMGVLPFFWIASLTVYLWARRYLDESAAAFAVLLFTFLPPILAHAGLATTDMALTAFVGASFLTALIWVGNPTPLRSILFGVITGLAVLSKFSALPFIPVALATAFVWNLVSEKRALSDSLLDRKYLAPLSLAGLSMFLIIWAGYRFSFGAVPFFPWRLPAPELYAGIQQVIEHNRNGDPSFLLGQHSNSGWRYYYAVVLAVKTPLPFLVLVLYGALSGRRNKGVRLALGFSLGILLFSATSRINLGVRHILPVYIGFSIVAAAGATRMLALSRGVPWARWTLGALLIWFTATSALSHPDYLPYFNVLAGGEPSNVLVDSDLDWGQDLKRLARRLKEVKAPSVTFVPFQPVDLPSLGFPLVEPGTPAAPSPGWNAVSLSVLKNAAAGAWPERTGPGERIGKGIWLWYFPPNVVPHRD